MEYKARHVQPFTLEQAASLEISVITTEIARLQNSLEHLRSTQQQLQENVESEEHSDPVLLQAFEENKTVVSSQEERISMLRLALELKGLGPRNNTHYDSPRPSDIRPEKDASLHEDSERSTSNTRPPTESDGFYL